MAGLTQMCRSTNSPLFQWWVSRPTHLSQWLSQHVHVVIRCGKLFSVLYKGLWSVESLPDKDLLLMCVVFSSEDWGCSQDSDEDSDQDSASEEDFKPARSTRTTRKYVLHRLGWGGGGGGEGSLVSFFMLFYEEEKTPQSVSWLTRVTLFYFGYVTRKCVLRLFFTLFMYS